MSDSPIVLQPRQNVDDGGFKAPQLPSGLECLAFVDQLVLNQKVEYFTCVRTTEFAIKNIRGERLFWSIDDTGCWDRSCNGNDMRVLDNYGNEVIHLFRPLTGCCSPWRYIEVSSPPGHVIGTVKQECSWCSPLFTVRDNNNDEILRIEGPWGLCSFTGDVRFRILASNNIEIGAITKHWAGLRQEMFTLADNFSIRFPGDLAIQAKALLLGACILLDAMYFNGKRK